MTPTGAAPRLRRAIVFSLLLIVGGCVGGAPRGPAVPSPPAAGAAAPQPAVPMPPSGAAPIKPGGDAVEQAASLALRPGPALATLPLEPADAAAALAAFRTSCPALLKRADSSGLTQPEDWAEPCADAARRGEGDARAFFLDRFETLQVGDGKAFATGYFEPEIAGVKERRPGFDVPVYGVPGDLVEVDLGQFSDEWKGKRIRGKVEGQRFIPYDDRAAIEQGRLAGRAPIIAWVADPIEFFFLQVQGSGRLRAPDGRILRIGYAGQNGRDYTGIGRLMRERGLLAPGQASMQGIIAWLRANPDEGRRIMHENKSYIFFRELDEAGARGALGYPVVGESSVAVDPRFVPLGAPVYLSLDRAEPNGLWVAQDTGGAIKGPNRFDTFWGAGDRARAIAGGMSARGTALLLLPKASVERLRAASN